MTPTAEELLRQFVDLTVQEADARPVADREWDIDGYGRVGPGNVAWWWTNDWHPRDTLRLNEQVVMTFRCSGVVSDHRVTRTK